MSLPLTACSDNSTATYARELFKLTKHS